MTDEDPLLRDAEIDDALLERVAHRDDPVRARQGQPDLRAQRGVPRCLVDVAAQHLGDEGAVELVREPRRSHRVGVSPGCQDRVEGELAP